MTDNPVAFAGGLFGIVQTSNYRYADYNAEAEYWSGKIAYGDIVDGETGTPDSNKKSVHMQDILNHTGTGAMMNTGDSLTIYLVTSCIF